MSISEFFTESNPILRFVAASLVGGGIEYYREENVEQKVRSAIAGTATSWYISSVGYRAYRIYKDFNMYEFGITALGGMAGAYLAYNIFAKVERSDTKKFVSDGQIVIMGVAWGTLLADIAMNQKELLAMTRG